LTPHVLESGPRDTARHGTVVFVHGFPFRGAAWTPQLAALPDGWRGLALDLRGFGDTPLTARPGVVPTGRRIGGRIVRDDEPVLTMGRLAQDVADLIASETDGSAVVCGLSMGGYVALELWRRHPDTLRALVLADTRAGADSDEGRENRLRMAQTVRRDGVAPVASALVPDLLCPSTLGDRPTVVADVRDMILDTPPETIVAALAGMAARHDSTHMLPSIAVPTLVIAGEEDVLTPPSESRAMADAIPDATLTLIPHAGHLSNMENPDEFNAALARFLASLAEGSA
jgi:3-oxoadipate enol-lactonase